MPRPGNHIHIGEYLIERVSDIAGRPVPRKRAIAWLEVMASLIAIGIVVVVVRLTIR